MGYLAGHEFFPGIVFRGEWPPFADQVEKIVPGQGTVEIGNQNAHVLFESHRLPGCCQDGPPPNAIGVDLLLLKDQHLDRDMDK